MFRRLEEKAGIKCWLESEREENKRHVLQSEADPKVYTHDGTLPEVVQDF